MVKAIYLHIPFCRRKCYYCDFTSYADISYIDEYLKAIDYELNSRKELIAPNATLYIGGGTPSVLSITQLARLMEILTKHGLMDKCCEISIEANPESITADKLQLLRQAGINRLSFGVQSFDDHSLALIGRLHNAKQALAAIGMAQDIGFSNINLDLMYALPEQSMQQLQNDLKQAVLLNVPHVSAYCLKIEEGTELFAKEQAGRLQLPDEDTIDEMYDLVIDYLGEAGYNRYEISNYAKEGYESKHNQVYWHYENYIGIGVAACSLLGSERRENTYNLQTYLADYRQNRSISHEIEHINKSVAMSEYLFMNWRMTKGVSPSAFRERFGVDMYAVYPNELAQYLNSPLMERLPSGNLSLSKLGFKYSNKIFVDFLK